MLNESPEHELAEPIMAALHRVKSGALGSALLDFYLRQGADESEQWARLLHAHRRSVREALSKRDDVSSQTRSVLEAVLEDSPRSVARSVMALEPEARLSALTRLTHRPAVLRRLPWLKWLGEYTDSYGGLTARVAAQVGLRKHLPAIRNLLIESPNRHLIRIVSEMNDRESVPLLVKLIERGDHKLMPFLLSALGAMGGNQARKTLRDMTNSEAANEGEVRLAYQALAECATPDDVDLFRDAVHHADWSVRLASADVLGRIAAKEDVTALAALAADPVSVVAQAARPYLEARGSAR